ncbi:uncharacterized protein SKDI_07G0780 [Saccharomyces kudriavzevii IFO 1802]|uniref:Uncharacterized protein n=1 Tax=Saccharomyces kudriavzevii (strain ATCC MYA-4449 / AS 2.2408 / CBS 8840 / NBRC 1802 / NCYC 2889) TaxID=226230 RepID=A0AA35JID3_SACK1|nr:uncharacterized protein SKDI_07G0780 [Saccharomyces kudriavzevii IFO 1802]CAI4061537.1 hypothetical protein SKDI_07G0780 [Saccharomyces kudriavzevii IFO 1802]
MLMTLKGGGSEEEDSESIDQANKLVKKNVEIWKT